MRLCLGVVFCLEIFLFTVGSDCSLFQNPDTPIQYKEFTPGNVFQVYFGQNVTLG